MTYIQHSGNESGNGEGGEPLKKSGDAAQETRDAAAAAQSMLP